ncbi:MULTISPECIES: DUF475 domain-containing protein [unclassified Thioclava]|uniref:DUF475 domain-containing protein n=1 Tax=unclassified Thioclava TaxID=2621713 RepID=UPI000997E0BA|nr:MULTISPECIES: DUF475 domain-containing protein [unclassified Thioclava]OOY05241.1 hypothetical protein BMI87_09570 [Thioclava sp. F28-4]OOY08610.1 hypothetical protein BMI89_10555 [Thioclava sp. F36-7]
MTTMYRYFSWAIAVTIAGLVGSFALGFAQTGGLGGAVSFLMITAVLAVLEISLSFDNAIVNANKLHQMTPKWQRRFLTWGILIAVFGMRILFPLLIVVIAAGIGPWEAVQLAAKHPAEYAEIIEDAHLSIAGFGGAFLMMVALTYFIDEGKEVDWIRALERRLRALASIRGLEIGLVLLVILAFTWILPEGREDEFMFASICGLATFLGVEVLSHVLDRTNIAAETAKAGLGAFLYLEVLDASFSFDGVIGAFALTQNLFLIAIGLGIGAMYVRSMTLMLVERNTLSEFRYLENGAFWSILILSVVMFAQTLVEVPEVITGLIGAGLIGLALLSSIRFNKRSRAAVES